MGEWPGPGSSMARYGQKHGMGRSMARHGQKHGLHGRQYGVHGMDCYLAGDWWTHDYVERQIHGRGISGFMARDG